MSKDSLDMFCYGYLFGFIKLIKDSHHDEVYIEQNGLVIIENGVWRHTHDELIAIARTELNLGKVTVIKWEEYDNG